MDPCLRSARSWHDIGTAPSSRGSPRRPPPPSADPPTWQAPPPPPGTVGPRPAAPQPTDKILGGVNGGLAEYTGIDALLWRVGFVALTPRRRRRHRRLPAPVAAHAGRSAGRGPGGSPHGGRPGRPPLAGSGHHDRGPAHPHGRDGDVQQLQPGEFHPRGYFGVALLVVGLGLVAAAFATGRTARGGLIALGVVLSLGLIAAASEPWEGTGDGSVTGSSVRTPRRACGTCTAATSAT